MGADHGHCVLTRVVDQQEEGSEDSGGRWCTVKVYVGQPGARRRNLSSQNDMLDMHARRREGRRSMQVGRSFTRPPSPSAERGEQKRSSSGRRLDAKTESKTEGLNFSMEGVVE